MRRSSSNLFGSVLVAIALGACAEGSTAPQTPVPDLRGSLAIAGHVVRGDAAAVDVPIRGASIYLYVPVTAGTKRAQWVHLGGVLGFNAPQGFWAIVAATGRTQDDGSFRFEALRSGAYVLWVVPDVLKGCSRGAIMSVNLSSPGIEPLMVRAL